MKDVYNIIGKDISFEVLEIIWDLPSNRYHTESKFQKSYVFCSSIHEAFKNNPKMLEHSKYIVTYKFITISWETDLMVNSETGWFYYLHNSIKLFNG